MFVAMFYSSAAASEDAQQSQVEKNCFGILKSVTYELHSFILKSTANQNIGPVPGQATCRPWESRLQGREHSQNFQIFGFFSTYRVDCWGTSKGN